MPLLASYHFHSLLLVSLHFLSFILQLPATLLLLPPHLQGGLHLLVSINFLLLYLLCLSLLLSFDFRKLCCYVLLLLLALHFLYLHLKLVRHHLVGFSRFTTVLLPVVHVSSLVHHNLTVQSVELFTSDAAVVILLLLLELFEQLLVGLEFKIGYHFVLQARLVLVLLGTGDGLHFFFNGSVFLIFNSLLMLQRCLNGVFDCLDVLEPRQSL